jgi:cell division cycle protein 20 (cofactor of APC complex)
LQKIYDVPAHDARVLCSSISPDGCTVATAASDENLKFWKIWEARSASKKGEESERDASGRSKSAVKIR